jgi:hypothetical protein
VESYLVSTPKEQKEDFLFLHNFIKKTVPKLKLYFASNMLGYDSFPWRNSKKELISWPTISLASQKNYITVFVCSVEDGKYLLENYKKELGKVNVGKTSISIKKIDDLNLPGFKKVLLYAQKHPGLRGLRTK